MQQRRTEARRRAVRRRRTVAAAVLLLVLLGVGVAVAGLLDGGSGSASPGGSTHRSDPPSSDAERTSSTTTQPRPRPRGHTAPARSRSPRSATRCSAAPGTCRPIPATTSTACAARSTATSVFGNLEGTLTNATVGKCGAQPAADCFEFRVPPEFAHDLRQAGFTMLSQGNNHSFDYGQAGLDSTISALDHAGIRHTGRTHEITYVRSGNLKIAFIGFGPLPQQRSAQRLPCRPRLIHEAAAACRHRGDVDACRRRGRRRRAPDRAGRDLPG